MRCLTVWHWSQQSFIALVGAFFGFVNFCLDVNISNLIWAQQQALHNQYIAGYGESLINYMLMGRALDIICIM
jgi:hypothetical protein